MGANVGPRRLPRIRVMRLLGSQRIGPSWHCAPVVMFVSVPHKNGLESVFGQPVGIACRSGLACFGGLPLGKPGCIVCCPPQYFLHPPAPLPQGISLPKFNL